MKSIGSWTFAAAILFFMSGCKTDTPSNPSKSQAGGHPTEGPHGGPVAGFDHAGKEIGHAEVTVSDDGMEVVVYFLDEKAVKAMKTPADKITAVKIKFDKPKETKWIELKHDKDRSGDKGHAFVGNLAEKMEVKNKKDLAGEISATIDGTIFPDCDFPEKH